jgi:hypothetical protein
LFPGGENEVRPAVNALQHLVPVIHNPAPLVESRLPPGAIPSGAERRQQVPRPSQVALARSVLVVPGLLTVALASQGCLDPLLFSRLQIEGMPFDFLDDVFLLNFPLKAAQGILQGFAFLNSDFSQTFSTSISV